MQELRIRLKQVASLVRAGSRIADIGADHGYLVCALVRSGHCPQGFACDINKGPLQRSAETIRQQGLEDRVQAILANGLEGLAPDMADDIVIAGMGGDLIADILLAVSWTKNPALHFVLQPMTKADHLRRRLCANGFAILREAPVEDGRFLYTVLSVVYTGEKQPRDKLYELVGEIPREQSPQSKAYLLWQQRKLEHKLAGLKKSGDSGENQKETAQLLAAIKQLTERS